MIYNKIIQKTIFIFCIILGSLNAFSQGATSDQSLLLDSVKVDNYKDHNPKSGINVAKNNFFSLNLSFYASLRYLNQKGLADSYTDSFGREKSVMRRADFQLFKAIVYFQGWAYTPKFNYTLFLWANNAVIGQPGVIYVVGGLNYKFNERIMVGGGLSGVPSTRTMRASFPYWNRVDARTIADEYFRAGFSMGVWAEGYALKNLYYKIGIFNNLSQLGIDAGQLNTGFKTLGVNLYYTSDDYNSDLGTNTPQGDFEDHQKLAYTIGAGYTRSPESNQSQADVDAPENSQIRISDGTRIFDVGAFAPGVLVKTALYNAGEINAGIKFKGFALDAEYYIRNVSDLDPKGVGPDPPTDFSAVPTTLNDHGFQVEPSMMIIKRKLLIYAFYSTIYGEYGVPWETGGGLSYFPYETRGLRINLDISYVDHSPVGGLSNPYQVGGTGTIWMINMDWRF